MASNKIYQVSTLQALALGYTRPVVTVREFLEHGDTGLGTFQDVDGEMIVADGVCYQAKQNGGIVRAPETAGVPFAVVGSLQNARQIRFEALPDVEALKTELTLRIEEGFGLNSIHIARIDGEFGLIRARAGAAYRSQHVSLKEILSKTQKDFCFENIAGTLICVYYPDYMDGINAPGWHLHFISSDRTLGGHVFDVDLKKAQANINKINLIELQLPNEPVFDTYSLKHASKDEIKEVEQGK